MKVKYLIDVGELDNLLFYKDGSPQGQLIAKTLREAIAVVEKEEHCLFKKFSMTEDEAATLMDLLVERKLLKTAQDPFRVFRYYGYCYQFAKRFVVYSWWERFVMRVKKYF